MKGRLQADARVRAGGAPGAPQRPPSGKNLPASEQPRPAVSWGGEWGWGWGWGEPRGKAGPGEGAPSTGQCQGEEGCVDEGITILMTVRPGDRGGQA